MPTIFDITRQRHDTSTEEGLRQYAHKVGFGEEAEKIFQRPKLSFLQRLGRGLTAFETGNSLYMTRYKNASFLDQYASDVYTGLKEAITGRQQTRKIKKTFKDIMTEEGWKDRPGKIDPVDVLGLVGDIAADPLTYFGGAIGRGITKATKVGYSAAKKIPKVGRVIGSAEEGIKSLFKPLHKAGGIVGKGGKTYEDIYLQFAKGTRSLTDELLDDVVKTARGVQTKVGKKSAKRGAKEMMRAVEEGARTGNDIIDEALDHLLKTQEALTEQELKRGVLKTVLPDYMHHMYTKEAAEFFSAGGNMTHLIKPIQVRLNAAKQRGILKFINENGEVITGKAEALGLKRVGGITGIMQDLQVNEIDTLKGFQKYLGQWGYQLKFVPKAQVHRANAYFDPMRKHLVVASKGRSVKDIIASIKHEISHGSQFQGAGQIELMETFSKRGKYKHLRGILDTAKDWAREEREGIWKAIGIDYKSMSKHYQAYYRKPTELLAHAIGMMERKGMHAGKLYPKTAAIIQKLHKVHPMFKLIHENVDNVNSMMAKHMYRDAQGNLYRGMLATANEINQDLHKFLGFDLFEEDAFKVFAARGIDSIKAVQTHDFLKRVGEQFGRKSITENFVDEFGVKWISAGQKELKGYLLPEPIAKHLDETYKVLTNDESTNALLRYYDKGLTIFKGAVTGYFPAFHTRNAMGGMFNNWIAGLSDVRLYKTAHEVLKGNHGYITMKNGMKVSYDNLRKMIKEYGVVGQTGYLDVAKYLKKEIDPTLGSRILKAPQQVMGWTEDHLRVPLFIDSLKKGLSPEKAAKKVIQFHFDYMPEGFTAFEKNIMKRIIPFYTWTRHNIPLQIEQMIKQPGKYAGVFKLQRSFGVTPSTEEEEVLPRWLKERVTIKHEGGYWSGVGLPLEEATEKLSAPLRGFGISMSPFIKIPIEQLTGYNIFKEGRIDEDNYGKYYKNAPDWLKGWLQLRKYRSKKNGKIYYSVNPKRKYWLEVVGMRGLTTALKVSNAVDDRKNLLSLITTIKKYDYAIDDLKKWSDTEKRRELERLLLQAGLLSEFKRTYVPKVER